MRERLVAAFVGIAVLVLVLFGVFRAYSIGDLVREQEARSLDRSAVLIADLVGERESAGRPVSARYLEGLLDQAERLTYIAPDGTQVEAGAQLDTEDPASIRGSGGLPGGRSVTLAMSGDLVDQRVAEQLLPLVLLGILMIAVSAVLGYVAAVRMSRPFQDLARVAGELGRGRFDVDIPHYSIPEAETVGAAMRESTARLDEMVGRERDFAANASHRLRTPITALRLDLEDLSMWPEAAGPVAQQIDRAVAEVDRLSSEVSDMLDVARGRRVGALVELDLSALVADTVERWRPRVGEAGRTLAYDGRDTIAVRLGARPISQILDALIEAALTHGSGTITVDLARRDRYARVSVHDEGRRTLAAGHDLGLAVATETADALGGHLTLDPDGGTSFSLMLPTSARVG